MCPPYYYATEKEYTACVGWWLSSVIHFIMSFLQVFLEKKEINHWKIHENLIVNSVLPVTKLVR